MVRIAKSFLKEVRFRYNKQKSFATTLNIDSIFPVGIIRVNCFLDLAGAPRVIPIDNALSRQTDSDRPRCERPHQRQKSGYQFIK